MIITFIQLAIYVFIQIQISKIFKLDINEIKDISYPHNRIAYDF